MILNNTILDLRPEWQKYPWREGKRPVIMSLIAMIKTKGNRFVIDFGDKIYKLESDEQIYKSIQRKFQRKLKGKKRNVVDPPPRKKGEEEW